ncbi:MAG: arylsulfatase [Pirellulales bacterium]|nr:arylsulfatase [Pirellulales bacterium]
MSRFVALPALFSLQYASLRCAVLAQAIAWALPLTVVFAAGAAVATDAAVAADAADAADAAVATDAADADPPNIVIVLADDMGFSDIGCYGGEIQTPSLDHLAEEGVRFTHFYNAGRCCPTRASLLTGLYPHQAGVGNMIRDQHLPGYRGQLNRDCVTMAEVLKTAGYYTAAIGKWHLTRDDHPGDAAADRSSWPLQRGFDFFYGTLPGGGSYYNPKGLTRGNDPARAEGDFYYTDSISREASAVVDRAAAMHKPLFLYVAYTAPHWPLHAPEEDVARYRKTYAKGWDRLRAERYQRMVDMGLIEPQWKLSPRDHRVPAWEDTPQKDWQIERMAVYAAQIDRMDRGIGQIVEALNRTHQMDNTLFIFLADNGGCSEIISPRPVPADHPEAKFGNLPGVMPGSDETFASYGIGWANLSNTPFRKYKTLQFEGGTASPLIVHWPVGIAAERNGSLVDESAHLIDLMATAVDVSGATYPQTVGDQSIQPMEGISLTPALTGRSLQRDAPLYFEHIGHRAVRDLRWKLVCRGPYAPWELYDMQADRTEVKDLAAEQPERVRQMVAAWDRWASRVRAKPWPHTPTRKPSKQKK